MKGPSHPKNDLTLNPSGNSTIHDVIDRVEGGRRRFIQSSLAATALASSGGLTLSGLMSTVQAASVAGGSGFPGIGFAQVPASLDVDPSSSFAVLDRVTVPVGYTAKLFVAWGDPIMSGAPAFLSDASQSATDQAKQFGMHNDGMHFFPFMGFNGVLSSTRGVLCVNHEYTHEEVLFTDGQMGDGYTIAKTRKSQAAHGISVLEARRVGGAWTVLKKTPYGRRITANTPCAISGPAAGHGLLQTQEFLITEAASTPTGQTTNGRVANGTVNNCAHGVTPWGTYLTCEENWNGLFGGTGAVDTTTVTEMGRLNRRYGITATGAGYRWHTTDPRWDVTTNPHEPHLFGWVVEIDPLNRASKPIKRTALGRFKHESAQCVVDSAERVAFYMGDDERNEYIYKFVCAGTFNPNSRASNRHLLDSGTLYVAKFNSDLSGQWLPLVPETMGVDGLALRDNPNFAGADDAAVLAKILIKTRMAADAVGATMMDRPEWTGARPRVYGYDEIEVYCTLSNNSRRGSTPSSVNLPDGSSAPGSSRPPVDAANPREDNVYGHIIRWREAGKTVTATTFAWDIFVQAGDTATTKVAKPTNDYKGNIVDTPDGSADYGAPDGLWFDHFGRLWIQTDQIGNSAGDFGNIGSNVLVCADPNTGQTRRFLTSPNGCEVTGITMTPDARTMWVGIQHPGGSSTAANPQQFSSWPAVQWSIESDGVTPLAFGRPRSAVVVITKDDGGVIGA